MALNNEDKKDVAKHMGKALANKVSKVTKDGKYGSNKKPSTINYGTSKAHGKAWTKMYKSAGSKTSGYNSKEEEAPFR
jgi:hypothetical protein